MLIVMLFGNAGFVGMRRHRAGALNIDYTSHMTYPNYDMLIIRLFHPPMAVLICRTIHDE